MSVRNPNLTLEQAWAKTIKKWSTVSDDLCDFTQPDNCGLCQKFHSYVFSKAKCTGCPIARITKKPGCLRFTGYTRMIKLRKTGEVTPENINKIRVHGLEKLIQIKAKSEKA
jgi:hypothetical protein